MDRSEGMTFQGSSPYYLNRGGIIGSHHINTPSFHLHGGSSSSTTALASGLHTHPIFRPHSNPSILVQSNARVSGGSNISGSSFRVENPSPNYQHGIMSSGIVSSGDGGVASQGGELVVKKKRGRPKKYGPDGTNVALGLSPVPPRKVAAEPTSSGEKARRGRPPGTGWKQKLAPLGEWMNSSAGLAFSPHVLHVGAGEDIAAKVLAFAQQRPRALCVMSANGSVSAMTLRQPSNSGATITYEGRFEILCFSGSYLVSENGGPRNRTGGISISVCSPDGHIIGGAIGGRLIALSPVQVVACSFVHGANANSKAKFESETKDQTSSYSLDQTGASGQNLTITPPYSGTSTWPMISRPEVRNPQTDIDLTRG